MLDQTSISKARRVLSRKVEAALQAHLTLIKKHVDSMSAAVEAANEEPEDLVQKLLTGGTTVWGYVSLKPLDELRSILVEFNKVIAKISSADAATHVLSVAEIAVRDVTVYSGTKEFAAGTDLAPEDFSSYLKGLYDVFHAANLRPAFHTDETGMPKAYLQIHW